MTTRKNGTKTREAPDEAAPPVAAIESRGSRRKRETRERLLDAAFRLMAERGMDTVAINEITEAADVGFGSFYNHFDSKDAIYREVISEAFDSFADALDELVAVIDDPAEVIAVSIRHTLLRARRDPLWAHLLLREGLSPRATSGGLAPRLLRDIEKGVARRRFKVPDPMMTFVAVAGGVLAAIATELQIAASEPTAIERFGRDGATHIPERTAAVLLHSLGLTFAQAQAIARRPLPARALGG